MCLQKVLQPEVRSCSWKPSGQLNLRHTKHTQDPPFYLFLIFLLPSISPSAHVLSPFSFPNLYLLFITLPLLPHCFFPPLFLSLKKEISYSLMHGSCREQCYFIFPWQPSFCFSGSDFSFGSNVLFCQR